MSFSLPQYIQLYPTTKCNQKCYFCFNNDPPLRSFDGKGNRGFQDLSYEKALKLLDILNKNGIYDIDIMGGEPLILPWITDFIHASVRRDTTINISTNGSFTKVIQKFNGINPQKLNIGVSLEGSTPERHNRITNSKHYDSAVETIKQLIFLNLDPVVKTVISRNGMGDIQNIINLIKNLGVRRYYIIHMDLLTKKRPIMDEGLSYVYFLNFYRRIKTENPGIEINSVNASCFNSSSLPHAARCAAGVRKLSILPDGSVFPCNLLNNIKGFNLGNIFENSLQDIWLNPALRFFRSYKSNKCSIENCTNKPACRGGCPAHGYYHYSNPDMPDIRCLV